MVLKIEKLLFPFSLSHANKKKTKKKTTGDREYRAQSLEDFLWTPIMAAERCSECDTPNVWRQVPTRWHQRLFSTAASRSRDPHIAFPKWVSSEKLVFRSVARCYRWQVATLLVRNVINWTRVRTLVILPHKTHPSRNQSLCDVDGDEDDVN